MRPKDKHSLRHYLERPVLWRLIAKSFPAGLVAESKAERLALSNAHPLTVIVIAAVCQAYHHIKTGSRDLLNS